MGFGSGDSGDGGTWQEGDSTEYDEPTDPRAYTFEGQQTAIPGVPGTGLGLSTVEGAMNSWLGDTRTDQESYNDAAVTKALQEGNPTFRDARGNERSVSGYERDFSPPEPDSALDKMGRGRMALGPVQLLTSAATGGLSTPLQLGIGFLAGQVDKALNTPEMVTIEPASPTGPRIGGSLIDSLRQERDSRFKDASDDMLEQSRSLLGLR